MGKRRALLALAVVTAVTGVPVRAWSGPKPVQPSHVEPNDDSPSPAGAVSPGPGKVPDLRLTTSADDRSGARAWSAAGLVGLYAGLGTWAYFAWYHNVETLPEFEVGGDGWFGRGTYAAGADKMGHFWANYAITRGSTKLLEYGGWDTLPASIISGSLAWTLFAFVEVKDGFYYQLSIGDTVGNTVGVLLGILMENVPEVDRWLDFPIQYWPSSDYRRTLTEDGDLDVAEDYSGQTYLAALHLKAIPGLTNPRWMRWARYVDVVGGFESRNYLPEPDDGDRRRMSVFFGFKLNIQHLLSELYDGPPERMSHKVAHGIFELYSPPYTTVRVSEATRYEPGIEPDE
ncbi:MAG: YfiM family protein [Deltaproteobacteria bacterium]|nr:YfiM family protein [Deltaproteobacteria bacterium]